MKDIMRVAAVSNVMHVENSSVNGDGGAVSCRMALRGAARRTVPDPVRKEP